MNNRFSFDQRRPQTDRYSIADKEDMFAVQLETMCGASSQEHRAMCKRMYKTFRKRILN